MPTSRRPPRDRRLCYAPLETRLGRLLVGFRGETVVRSSVTERPGAFAAALGERFGVPPEARPSLPASLGARVRAAVEGGICVVDVDLSALTRFQQRVLRATAQIPSGETRTYGEVAEAVGAPRAARAVGTALSRNPVPLVIPCHRVVRSGGEVGEYGMGGKAIKRRLLRGEGSLTAGGRVRGRA